MGGAWSHRGGGNIHSDGGSYRVLRLEVHDLMVLQELSSSDPLNQQHNLWGIPTFVESYPGNVDDLLSMKSNTEKWLF
jgi:hypothetical protein